MCSMTLTIFCALCGHSKEQHTLVFNLHADPKRLWYCLASCPCNGSTTFQGKGAMTPTRRGT